MQIAVPDPDYKYHLFTDACNVGLGATLAHIQPDGGLKPVCYMSRKLTPTEKKLWTHELELLAIVDTIKAWSSGIGGLDIHVVDRPRGLDVARQATQVEQ